KILWKNLSLPSVSLILKSTMSPENIYILEEWEKKMIAQMGISEFELYKKALFENGYRLHSCIKSFLEGQMNVNISPSIEGYWNSVQHVLEEIEDTIALELPVQNTNLNYKGILDGVFVYKKKLCVVEWKTSKRLKSSLDKTFDNPLQLVAYLAAFNQQLFHPDFVKYKQKIEKINLQTAFIENCLLVITYEDGTKADVHHMNREICNKYWEDWLQRLHKY
ncbi:hypothetical protein HELRODRAFT_150875, partial [Helobdella robusta]|uniref:Mitochondrial genome maintenance exonuclease 1 n=1 Tax=Helobdella robusta TaxID=6412 RepID=T1EKH7_HELRO